MAQDHGFHSKLDKLRYLTFLADETEPSVESFMFTLYLFALPFVFSLFYSLAYLDDIHLHSQIPAFSVTRGRRRFRHSSVKS
jgi:hypothetical protein